MRELKNYVDGRLVLHVQAKRAPVRSGSPSATWSAPVVPAAASRSEPGRASAVVVPPAADDAEASARAAWERLRAYW